MAKYELDTIDGYNAAWKDYWWKDHAFLRKNFDNAHQIGPGVWRSNQPSPDKIAYWKQKGIKTIFNLRGDTDSCFTHLEKHACQKLGIDLRFFKVESRGAPDPKIMHAMYDAFKDAEYPILLHCKSGADRAGFTAVFYKFLIEGVPLEEARQQLNIKYLHISAGKTGILGYFWDQFEKANKETGIEFWDWVDNVYDRDKLKASFKPTKWGNWIVDTFLHRE